MLKRAGIRGFFLVFACFFLFELVTLTHYGTDWDTINHLPRGQAYLRYFLTGKLTYADLPEYVDYHQKDNTLFFSPDKNKSTITKRSIYQLQDYTGTYFLSKDGGHPPLSDILASVFNLVLFQKLGLINDIDSYHIYIILTASFLAGLLFWWTKKRLNCFSAIIATLSLVLYPLFLAESHFNLKDVPEATFYTAASIFLFEGVTTKRKGYFLIASVFFGLAWGTKFNILFLPLGFAPWLFLYLRKQKQLVKNLRFLIQMFLLFSVIAAAIFFGSWPYLWKDPFTRFLQVVSYYKTIGINTSFDRSFINFGLNTYALQWILYTTPLITLFFSGIGIISSIFSKAREQNKTTLFVLFWFLVPIGRVTIPNAGIYGGVRQIMEFIPPLAILSGIGASYLWNAIHKRIPTLPKALLTSLFVLSFVPITLKLISIHPNENVYFNPLIGGLEGAKEKNFPYWGNSFGNAYRQGTEWVNQHAQPGSTLVLAQELMPNLPKLFVRSDLKYGNNLRSGYIRNGEYVIGLDYGLVANRSYYSSQYYYRTLNPIYQIKIDNTSILNIWKNDVSHTKKGFIEEKEIKNPPFEKTKRGVVIDLKKPFTISGISWKFSNINCVDVKQIYFSVSADGYNWHNTPHTLPEDAPIPILPRQPINNSVTYPFASEYAQHIYILIDPENACPKNIDSLSVFYLPQAPNPAILP